MKNIIVIIAILTALVGGGIVSNHVLNSRSSTTKEYQIIQRINDYRTQHHLHTLTPNVKLASVAKAHSKDMVRRHYFAHSKSNEDGEVLAWGTGGFSSPNGIVSLWRSSAPHKKVLLTPSLKYVGVGIATGTFYGQKNATVVTAEFKR